MAGLGFAIVGCGMIARFHVRALAECSGARLAALVSRNPANAEALLAETAAVPCPIYANTDEMLARSSGVDAVIICTASGAHLEDALKAANAKKHVVVEKPLEVTPERCDRIIGACAANGVKLCTIFPSRFHDANIALKEAVDAGRFGRPTLAETTCKWWRSQAYYDEGGWKGTLALDGGGALMNQAIHSVDLLLWMMGDVESVSGFTATLAHERIEVEDTAVACLKFKSGALGVIQATTSIHPGFPKTIAIHGDKGSAVIEQEDILKWEFAAPLPGDAAIKERFAHKRGLSGGAADPKAISHQGHARQLADFIRAIETDNAPRVDGAQGRRAVALICAIYESMRTGSVARPG